MMKILQRKKQVKKVSYVGPNYKEVFYKDEAQRFKKDEAEKIKNSLTNKKSYIELA